MKETVLLYGFKDQERLKKVKRALLPLGLRMRTVGRRNISSRWDTWPE